MYLIGQRRGIRFLWACMLLAETVSARLASNLFYFALVLSPKDCQRREVFAGPYLWGTTALSLYVLSRFHHNAGSLAPQTLAFIHFLPLVPLLQPVWTYSVLSVRREWSYHFVHVVSAVMLVPALITALLATRPLGVAHSSTIYYQWFASILAHLQQSSAAQDLLCISISFTAFIISQMTSRGSVQMLSTAYLVVGLPFLNATSGLVLAITGDRLIRPPSPTPHFSPESSLTLLKRIEIYVEDGPNKYHFLWTKDSHIFYAASPVGPYELSDLVGTLVPIGNVYPPWRASVREACDPLSPESFVKYPYGSIIIKLLDDTDVFSRINAEIDVLQQLAQVSHPNIVDYRGCLRRGNLLVGICLRKYPCSLSELVEDRVAADK